MKFQLGIHQPADAKKIEDPRCDIMISVRRLKNRKKKVEAPGYWYMDSGGFTEIRNHGKYTMTEDEYLEIIWHHRPKAAYCQDWMVEPEMLERTGLTIEEHQRRTVQSFRSLTKKLRDRNLAASENGETFCTTEIRPVLQGWTLEDYLNHMEMYMDAGVHTYRETFGIGSLCCRSSERIIRELIEGIHNAYPYVDYHAFGLKITALKDKRVQGCLVSSDSMAWSLDGRFEQYRNPHKEIFKKANNRLEYALTWREKVLHTMRIWKYEPHQLLLFT
jgi:hypothetical protein